MKRKNYFWSLLTVVISVGMMMSFSSCGGDDEGSGGGGDTPTPTQGTIKVNGSTSTILSYEGNFNGKSGVDFKQAVSVTSDVEWTMSTGADWLSISPQNGKGTVEMTIYPKSENPSSEARTATIILSGGGASATIKVEQYGGASSCKVSIANEVALYNRMCWEYTASGDANMFQWILLPESEYKLMTDNELTAMVKKREQLKFAKDYLSSTGIDSNGKDIEDNTTYYVVTLASDKDDKYGVLNKQKITTPVYKNGDDDAWVSFSNKYYGSSGFQFDAAKEGRSDKYHIIYGINYEIMNPVVFAFEINYYLKNKEKHWLAKNEYYEWEIQTDYPNNHTFTYTNQYISVFTYVFGYGWGIFPDGTLSSDLLGFQGNTSSSAPMQRAAASTDVPKNELIIKSEYLKRVKKQMHK